MIKTTHFRKTLFTIFTLILVFGLASQAMALDFERTNVLSNFPISVAPMNQAIGHFGVVPDGSGGFFFVFSDGYYYNIFAQRSDANDQLLWPENGIPIAPGDWYQTDASAASDAAGGFIVAWVDGRNTDFCGPGFSANCDIYAQRVNSQGEPLWQAGGIPITVNEHNQGTSGINIIPDGYGGAIIAWEDAFPDCCRIYSQRVNAAGQVLWTINGVPVSAAITNAHGPMPGGRVMVSDGQGGAIFVWHNSQYPTGIVTISMQRISSTGTMMWNPSGVVVGDPRYEGNLDMVADTSGGAVIVWAGGTMPYTYSDNIYAQRIDQNGQGQWQAGGLVIAQGAHLRNQPAVTITSTGNFIAAWSDERNGDYSDCPRFIFGQPGNCDIYAQSISPAGLVQWPENGVAITTAMNKQFAPGIAPDDAGGAIIMWQDCRDYPDVDSCFNIEPTTAGIDLYAQHITANGQVLWKLNGAPVSVARGTQGGFGSNQDPGFRYAADDQGGVMVAFSDGRNYVCHYSYTHSDCDIYAQRVNDQSANIPPGKFFLPLAGR